MPIDLNNLQAHVTTVKTYSPKFFSGELTGAGKKIGLLNEARNPVNLPGGVPLTGEYFETRKRETTNGDTTTTFIPIAMLSREAWDMMDDFEIPPHAEKVATCFGPRPIVARILMQPHSLMLEKKTFQGTSNGAQGGVSKKLTPCYQILLFLTNDPDPVHKQLTGGQKMAKIPNSPRAGTPNQNSYVVVYTCDPVANLDIIRDTLEAAGYTIDRQAFADYVQNYSLYDAVCRCSETWQTGADKLLGQLFRNNTQYHNNSHGKNVVAHILHQIENYAIPLDCYRQIYKDVHATYSSADLPIMCKQNLNLLLTHTLDSLSTNKANLNHMTIPATGPVVPPSAQRLSAEQLRAVSSTDPLVLVQSGAGTGKSTVILSRIQYMVANGVDPNDITVLSFTNAAADHIIEKNPDVHAMTIARMIHNIYALNYPHHELSSLDTIINTLDIYYPSDPLANTFKHCAAECLKNTPDAFTTMNNFVERNFDQIMSMLDTMGQTSLELEIIICYQRIESLQEPPEVQSKHLIIDEVQDNSVFEFIYALKYVEKHNESLFIVGDCSQTLYEFRASNPRALNVLEGSGVFSAYQLQVNYRSNQEILDFANVLLQNIEANQYANIRLRANSLRPVTEQSFLDAVHFKYHELRKLADFDTELPAIIGSELRPYLTACMQRHEQVAFLAFTRQKIYAIQRQLEASYPGCKVAVLVPDKVYNSTIFSNFIRKYWHQVTFVPQQNLVGTIVRLCVDNLQDIVGYKMADISGVQRKTADLLGMWKARFETTINGWVAQANAGQMSNQQLLDLVKESMLKTEIQNNAARQAVIGERNRQRKEDQANTTADFVLSTIHSAKGLEFDHVVVLFQNQNDMPEDKKRMYYVGLTRAMKSEYVVAYDTVKKPKIQADYDMILNQLHAIAPAQPAVAATGPTPVLGDGGFPAGTTDALSGPAWYATRGDVDVGATVVGLDVTGGVPDDEPGETPESERVPSLVVPTCPMTPPAPKQNDGVSAAS